MIPRSFFPRQWTLAMVSAERPEPGVETALAGVSDLPQPRLKANRQRRAVAVSRRFMSRVLCARKTRNPQINTFCPRIQRKSFIRELREFTRIFLVGAHCVRPAARQRSPTGGRIPKKLTADFADGHGFFGRGALRASGCAQRSPTGEQSK